jgi:hypothetical protein
MQAFLSMLGKKGYGTMRMSRKRGRMVKPQKIATEDTSVNNSTRETKCRKQCLKKANVQVTLLLLAQTGLHNVLPRLKSNTKQAASIVLLKTWFWQLIAILPTTVFIWTSKESPKGHVAACMSRTSGMHVVSYTWEAVEMVIVLE